MAFRRIKNKLSPITLIMLLLVYYSPALSQNKNTDKKTQDEIDVFDVKTKDLEADLPDEFAIPDFSAQDDEINAFTEGLFGEEGEPNIEAPALPTANINQATPKPEEPLGEQEENKKTTAESNNIDEFMLEDENLFGEIPIDAKNSMNEETTTTTSTGDTPKQIANATTEKSEEEKAEYRKLKKHLLNFIKSLSGGEIIEVTENEQAQLPINDQTVSTTEQAESVNPIIEPETYDDKNSQSNLTQSDNDSEMAKIIEAQQRSNSEENELLIDDDFDDFLTPESQEEQDTPIEAKQDSSEIIGQIAGTITKIAEEQVQTFAGNCPELISKLDSCQEFTCSMPQSNGSDITITQTISLNQNDNCQLTEKKNEEVAFECVLDQESKNYLSLALLDHFESSGATAFELPNELKAKCPSSSSVKVAAIETEKKKASASLKEANEKTARKVTPVRKTTSQKPAKQPTIEEVLSEEDKAYFSLLEEKRKALPENKQLSEETLESVESIVPGLIPKTKPKSETKHVTLKRGRNLDNQSSSMEMSLSEENGVNLNVKEDMNKAYRALMAGQVSASVSIYKGILEKDHENKDALFGLATAYHRNSQFAQARAIYTEILKLEPNNKEVLNNFLVLVAEESPDNALIELQKLERINSDFSPIPAQIAMIHLKNNKPKKAERYLRRAVILSPDNITYKYNLAITSDRLGKYHQAARLYRQILEATKQGAIIPGSSDSLTDRLIFLEEKIRAKG